MHPSGILLVGQTGCVIMEIGLLVEDLVKYLPPPYVLFLLMNPTHLTFIVPMEVLVRPYLLTPQVIVLVPQVINTFFFV